MGVPGTCTMRTHALCWRHGQPLLSGAFALQGRAYDVHTLLHRRAPAHSHTRSLADMNGPRTRTRTRGVTSGDANKRGWCV